MKMGFTRAIRYVPVVMLFAMLVAWGALQESDVAFIAGLPEWLVTPLGAFLVLIGGLAVYALSFVISARLYRTRSF
ncbi:hypothetical protein BIFGAL_02638 [Bifidobacterium gallicum DSM 20093 = LMG 11596]|nr:hypothetical protein BIFGAL_02638 [Bifidobacterium gallicum DSM 20093 = LMG 11596]